jgi:hypothetical protein
MGGVTSALQHLSEFEVSIRLRQTTGREQRRWLVVWNALVDPRPASEIAIHTDVSVSTVHNVISRYNRLGPQAIEGCENGIRRRCYLSKDREAEFLKPFLEIAPTGEICVVGPIKQALEEFLGHPVHHSPCIGCFIETDGGRSCLARFIPKRKRKLKRLLKKLPGSRSRDCGTKRSGRQSACDNHGSRRGPLRTNHRYSIMLGARRDQTQSSYASSPDIRLRVCGCMYGPG